MASTLARALRRNATDAERRLWHRLRYRQLDGFRFRRQVPIGPYAVDFGCLSERLIIEVDGGQHDWQQERDEARTVWLEARGYRVLRFWNNDVLSNPDGVLERILEALKACPSRKTFQRGHPPSPLEGEGRGGG